MSRPIHLELPCSCDAAGMVEFLAARGLAATLTREDDQCTLEIRYAVDPDVRLRRDVEAAISSWLEDGGHALVPAVGREHEFVLRPPAD